MITPVVRDPPLRVLFVERSRVCQDLSKGGIRILGLANWELLFSYNKFKNGRAGHSEQGGMIPGRTPLRWRSKPSPPNTMVDHWGVGGCLL